MRNPGYLNSGRRQEGAALIVSLTLLLVVTVTALAAASGSNLQLGMAGATKNRNLAFQAAESALREGERRVARMEFGCGIDDVLPPDGGSQLLPVTDGGSVRVWDSEAETLPDPWDPQSWSLASAYERELAGINESPRYTVAVTDVEPETDSVIFQVTAGARAAGGGHAVVESTIRRRFERRIHIRGNADVNVVAIGDGLITARAQLGTNPDVAIDLGGWNPEGCDDDGAPVTLAYEGSGGTDTFIIADILGLGYAPGVGGLLDITAEVTGLERALSDYAIERVEVENPGSTAIAITTLDASGRFTTDNSYCINTVSGETGDGVLDRVIGGVVGGLLPGTALDEVLTQVAAAGEALVGSDGAIPLIPANASVIADGGGDDRYEIYSDTETAAFVTADLGGDDSYRLRATGNGFVQMPVLVDIGGSNSYDIQGGNHIRAALDSGALADLDDTVSDGNIGGLLDNLQSALNLLLGNQSCGGLLGGILCSVLNPLADLLDDILGSLGDLFDSHVEPGADAPMTQPTSVCHEPVTKRINWRERLR